MHHLTNVLSLGLDQLQLEQNRTNICGLPQESFRILLEGLTGQTELKSQNDFKAVREKLAALPETSVQLDAYAFSYHTLRHHSLSVANQLDLPKGVSMTPELKNISDNFIPQQVAYASCVTGLPQDQPTNQLLLVNLGKELLSHNITESVKNNTLTDAVGEKIRIANTNSGSSLTTESVGNLTARVSGKVGGWFKTGGSSLMAASLLFASLGAAMSSLGGSEEAEIEDPEKQRLAELEEESGQPNVAGTAMGFGATTIQAHLEREKRKKEKAIQLQLDQENKSWEQPGFEELKKMIEEKPVQPAVAPTTAAATPTPAPTGLPTPPITPRIPMSFPVKIKSFFSGIQTRIGGFFQRKVLGKVFARALGWIAGIASTGPIGAVVGFITSIPSILRGDLLPYAKYALYCLVAVLLVVFIPILITLFLVAGQQPAALVAQNIHGVSTAGQSTLLSELQPTSLPGQAGNSTISLPSSAPSAAPASENDPVGFPLNSSCVTTLPGQLTHAANDLNAIDLGEIAHFDSWWVRATHPGKVLYAGDGIDRYGNIVMLESLDESFITYYGHLEYHPLYVATGVVVERGQVLARVDNTGYSSGDHLHYELRGPKSTIAPYGSKEGKYGESGTILNFIPGKQTWDCNPPVE